MAAEIESQIGPVAVAVIKAFLPYMRERRCGHIVDALSFVRAKLTARLDELTRYEALTRSTDTV
jgi:hypothetical protein